MDEKHLSILCQKIKCSLHIYATHHVYHFIRLMGESISENESVMQRTCLRRGRKLKCVFKQRVCNELDNG